MREQLSAYAHAAWAAYMGYFLDKCIPQPDGGMLIPAGYVQAIERLIALSYADLSDLDKMGDQQEADKMLAIVRGS